MKKLLAFVLCFLFTTLLPMSVRASDLSEFAPNTHHLLISRSHSPLRINNKYSTEITILAIVALAVIIIILKIEVYIKI